MSSFTWKEDLAYILVAVALSFLLKFAILLVIFCIFIHFQPRLQLSNLLIYTNSLSYIVTKLPIVLKPDIAHL